MDHFEDDRAHLAQWRRDRQQALQAIAQQSMGEIKSGVSLLGELQTSLDGVLAQRSEIESQHKETAEHSEAIKKLAEETHARAQHEQHAKDAHLQHQVDMQDKARYEEEALQMQNLKAQSQQAAFDALFGLWRDNMGLDIQRLAPATVRVTFSFEEPHRECGFTLAAGDTFLVSDVTPALPESVVAALVNCLNEGQHTTRTALPQFVCCMRRAFLRKRQHARSSRRGGA